jgi:hypothetical protein
MNLASSHVDLRLARRAALHALPRNFQLPYSPAQRQRFAPPAERRALTAPRGFA